MSALICRDALMSMGRRHILRDMDATTDEDAASTRYDEAEEEFLVGVRTGLDRTHLTVSAEAVAAKAGAWNEVAYVAYHALSGDERVQREYQTEKTELLSNLWLDIARAFHGLEAYRDG